MARISSGDNSWKAAGLAKKYEDWESRPARSAPKKNKRRWCKGKTGVEHNYASKPKSWGNHHYLIYACTGCGKEQYRRPTAGVNDRQAELAAEWCGEGHLWDWEEFKPSYFEYRFVGDVLHHRHPASIFQREREWTKAYPWAHPTLHKVCLMCGLERRGQTRKIEPGDLKA